MASMGFTGTRVRQALRAGLGTAGAVALLFAGAPSADAGARGCNHRTCISVQGGGLRVDSVSASTTWNGDFTGHFHIWGGGLDTNSRKGFWGYHQQFTVRVGRDLPNRSVVCAEGWEHVDGGFQSRGRACEEIHL
ncbi:hypothetical protein I5Q34_08795 [Streptomyces sp. AV19]|uniref:hypothetical protein n=1 Tax=Streptomyces sp. AV19 TaxID=2793068 RepID=UPI0018FE0379|nr:hypothetical protein [Streptomyces sp. AV19]MBH1934386.1 hypothetical protein [Streptomyces sp. AV19]MDG4536236.1 hypothetical protein [Streptomyces sp. AV19]